MSLPFADIRNYWSEVRLGLEAIRRRCPNVRWIPEDVYAECVKGQALFCYENGNWIVLTEGQDPYSRARICYVWLAYGVGVNAMQERLDTFAAENGFDELRLYSPRKGWDKVPGWEYMETIYRREL